MLLGCVKLDSVVIGPIIILLEHCLSLNSELRIESVPPAMKVQAANIPANVQLCLLLIGNIVRKPLPER